MGKTIDCPVCRDSKPRCDNGVLIFETMTKRFLNQHMQVDKEHLELWRQWQGHRHDEPIDRALERKCKDFMNSNEYKSLYKRN